MKIAIYSKDGNLQTVYEEMNNPILVGTTVDFDGGSFSDLTDHHIFLDDDTVVPETLGEAIQLNIKSTLLQIVTGEEEIASLKMQLSETNALLMDFMESILQ